MKKTFIVLASLMVMICMICSCGGGSGSASADDAVAVRLGVNINDDTQNIISVGGQSLAGATFWYKAHPQWTGTDFTSIQGDTGSTWTKLTAFSYADHEDQTVGYFAQGSWKFEVQVTLGDTADTNVLYQTKKDLANIDAVYVNANSTQFDITVEKVINDQVTGTVSFDITTPAASGTDKLEVSYYPIDTPSSVTTISSVDAQSIFERTTPSSGIAKFAGNKTIGSGIYVFTATYYTYGGSPAAYTATRAQTVTVEVVAGGTTTVGGELENGVWKSTSFTIKGIKSLTATVAAEADPTYKEDEDVTFTCTATPDGFDPTPTIVYEWRLDGAILDGETNSTYTYTQDMGDHYVTCIAYVKEGSPAKTVVSASNTIKFTSAQK